MEGRLPWVAAPFYTTSGLAYPFKDEYLSSPKTRKRLRSG